MSDSPNMPASGSRLTDPGTGLYVHVPFCASKCAYCDFASAPADLELPETVLRLDAYCSAVRREVSAWEATGLLADVPSIYVGGGTPTLLGARLPDLIRDLRALPGVSADTEITCEANPDSLDEGLVQALADAGLTRVSLGVQSLDDEVLQWLGRRHDASRALSAARMLRRSGLRFSLDLMCGVPFQSMGSWEWTLADAIQTGAGHISVYPLSIEESTPLFDRVDAGESPDVDPDVAAEQMTVAAAALRGAGYERYEVASYALPGQECLHNARYWTGCSYLGVGPGAASMLPAAAAPSQWEIPADAARVRFTMHTRTGAMLCGCTDRPHELEGLTLEEVRREDAMLGLRLSRGITTELAEAAGATAALGTMARQGLVLLDDDRWRVTERGWLLGNEIFGRVWSGD